MSEPVKRKDQGAPEAQPAADVTQTPEFQQALQREVAKAVAANFDAFKAQMTAVAPGVAPATVEGLNVDGFQSLFRQLALSIAEVSDQGSGRAKRIPPEVLAAREEARQRMGAAIMRMRARRDELLRAGRREEAARATPRYRAMAKLFLNERLIDPFRIDLATKLPVPVEFYWDAAPGVAMRPLNEAALEIFNHYRDWIGGVDATAAAEAWVTARGNVMVVSSSRPAPETAMLRQRVQPDFGEVELQAADQFRDPNFDAMLSIDEGPLSASDPRRTEVPVFGTLSPPVKVGQAGDVFRSAV